MCTAAKGGWAPIDGGAYVDTDGGRHGEGRACEGVRLRLVRIGDVQWRVFRGYEGGFFAVRGPEGSDGGVERIAEVGRRSCSLKVRKIPAVHPD